MNGAVGDVLPLALAVTVSPVPIIAQILLLFSTAPKANAAAYLVGFLVGVGALLAVLVALAGTQDLSAGSTGSSGVGWMKIVLGVLLLLGAVRRLRNRPAPGEDPELPRWMAGIESFTPVRSLGLGLAISANPKNILLVLAAAGTIAAAGLTTGQQAVVVAVYAVVAAVGVAAPLVVAVALGSRAEPVLEAWRTWLADHNAAVMAVLFLLIGGVLIGSGLGVV